jgi:hypothetical protein
MRTQGRAALFASTVGLNQSVKYLTLALDTAQLRTDPYRISFGFSSFVVLDSTDSSVSINARIGSEDTNVDPFPLRKNSSLDLPGPIQKMFLDWPAQAGKTISILFLLEGNFKTNQLVSTVSANVNLDDGGTVTTQAGAQVLAAGGTLFAQDTTRNLMLIQNNSGASIWVGSTGVTVAGGAKPGIEIPSGGYYEWRSTAACVAIAAADTGTTDISLTKFSA